MNFLNQMTLPNWGLFEFDPPQPPMNGREPGPARRLFGDEPFSVFGASRRPDVTHVRREETHFESGPGYWRYEHRVETRTVSGQGGHAIQAPESSRRPASSGWGLPQFLTPRNDPRVAPAPEDVGEPTIEELPDEPASEPVATRVRRIAPAPAPQMPVQEAAGDGASGAKAAKLSSEVGSGGLWKRICAPFSGTPKAGPGESHKHTSVASAVWPPHKNGWTLALWSLLAVALLLVTGSFVGSYL